MNEEERRKLIFNVIESFLAINPQKSINVYYRFNPSLYLPLKFQNNEPFLLLEGNLISLNMAITDHFSVITNDPLPQNAYINLSFKYSEIKEIDRFKNVDFTLMKNLFTKKINYFANEYYNKVKENPELLKLEPIFSNNITLDNISEEIIEIFKPIEDEESFPEGKTIYRLHISKDRSRKVVALKKKQAYDLNYLLPCEACGLSFKEMYGEAGEKFIEAHHLLPLSELTEETRTKLEDLVLLCSNCHRMVHKYRPWLSTIEEIKSIIKK